MVILEREQAGVRRNKSQDSDRVHGMLEESKEEETQ